MLNATQIVRMTWGAAWGFARRIAADESTFKGACVETFLARMTEASEALGNDLILAAAYMLVERDGLALVDSERR